MGSEQDKKNYEAYVCDDVLKEVERFLHREARLLDTEKLREWHEEMVSPDISYVVTTTQLRSRKERRYKHEDKVYLYCDNYQQLGVRVNQFYDPQHWRVDPPEKYCRMISNIEAFYTDDEDKIYARSNCFVSRARRAYEVDHFFYTREDVLHRDASKRLTLLERNIDYPERSVQGRNMLVLL
ncbi:MAG TPA: naphthalene 1,2-dioxygenase [Thiotrichaceae bacterium]|jgi:naphthalene 1,2-dioxygenase subunit beta|nr:naphthalene 1,2-dioxygenase [Thiotrichaceae bacterium]HIM08011.1 naphthalene 1,2-dioxygenase [Gammaproteobacteria bacterium]